jgi:hypothetical protein
MSDEWLNDFATANQPAAQNEREAEEEFGFHGFFGFIKRRIKA